jgi:hypothetical protein
MKASGPTSMTLPTSLQLPRFAATCESAWMLGCCLEQSLPSIVMENAVIRGTGRHPTRLGASVLVGPRAYLTGCIVEDSVFLAAGATVFNGAHIGTRSEVRINGVIHIKTVLAPDSVVPIGWIAVGDPAEVLPPGDHESIWAIQETLDFPGTVFGLPRPAPGESIMPDLTRRYAKALARHKQDKTLP